MSGIKPVLLIALFLGMFHISQGQDKKCTIEIYLLKAGVVNMNPRKIMTTFTVDRSGLQDTAFIKNEEIGSLSIRSDSMQLEGHPLSVSYDYIFTVDTAIGKRVNDLKIPLCCGRQFALLINGQIAFVGYFWNVVSSFGCEAVTAFVLGNKMSISRMLPDHGLKNPDTDPRMSKELMTCLKETGRLK